MLLKELTNQIRVPRTRILADSAFSSASALVQGKTTSASYRNQLLYRDPIPHNSNSENFIHKIPICATLASARRCISC